MSLLLFTFNTSNQSQQASTLADVNEFCATEADEPFATSSTAPQIAISLTTPALYGGVYVVFWYGELSASSRIAAALITASIDGNIEAECNTVGQSQIPCSGHKTIYLAHGQHAVVLQIARVGGITTDTASIRRRRIALMRVG